MSLNHLNSTAGSNPESPIQILIGDSGFEPVVRSSAIFFPFIKFRHWLQNFKLSVIKKPLNSEKRIFPKEGL